MMHYDSSFLKFHIYLMATFIIASKYLFSVPTISLWFTFLYFTSFQVTFRTVHFLHLIKIELVYSYIFFTKLFHSDVAYEHNSPSQFISSAELFNFQPCSRLLSIFQLTTDFNIVINTNIPPKL